MIDIQFPEHSFKIEKRQDKDFIFDVFRKQWLLLTPEEWVRQNFLQYLVQVKKYPSSLIAVEREIALGDLRKRFDIVVFKNAQPWMVVECKEMSVPVNDAVIQQILNYNITLQAHYLVLTNGKKTVAIAIVNGAPTWLNALPDFD